MNDFVKAIHDETKYNVKLIEQVIDKCRRIHSPYFLPGTPNWDIWKMYNVLKRYEQLRQQRHNN